MSSFREKVVLITGSSIGIGRELAQQLAARGARIVLNARNPERLEQTRIALEKAGATVLAVPGDVADPNDCARIIDATIRHFGRLDVLINNAGLGTQFKLADLKPEAIRQIVDVNLNGALYCTHFALPRLVESKGSVVFIGSIAGIHGIPHSNVYSGTKMALTAIAEALRLETHGTGVHVGIAYVGFTSNDPEKKFVRPDGGAMQRPERAQTLVTPVDQVARAIIRMIEKRQHKRVMSKLGLTLMVLNRISPDLVSWILRRLLKKFSLEEANRGAV